MKSCLKFAVDVVFCHRLQHLLIPRWVPFFGRSIVHSKVCRMTVCWLHIVIAAITQWALILSA